MNYPTLKEWTENNAPSEKMRWYEPFYRQVNYVGRTLAVLFGSSVNGEFQLAVPEVVSTHCSKSIICPVSRFILPWGQVILRYNFFNWNVAVFANRDIEFDWESLIGEGHGNYLFLEGMENYRRPPYPEAKREFCFCVSGDFPCYGALLLIQQAAIRSTTGSPASA